MTAIARQDEFQFRVGLDADQIWARLAEHPGVRVAEDPSPDPAPPRGPPFLAARQSHDEVRLRHWAGPADATSPVVVVRLCDGPRGCDVEGRFIPRSTPGPLTDPRRRVLPLWSVAAPAGVLLAVASILYWGLGGTPLAFLFVFGLLFLLAVPAAVVLLPGMWLWNDQSRRQQVASLWQLIGEVFTPIALPAAEDEDPFRDAQR